MKISLLIVCIFFVILHCQSGKEECLDENPISLQCRNPILYLRAVDESCGNTNLCFDSLQRQNLFLISCMALDAQRKKCKERISISFE
ncbi:hypothetical protein EHQ94_03320 [Leptospira meyeri]|uniref:hypothetical protein n=1 Tax=Leptospira meyeri TaxID=29508 RepID=UPI001083EA49|nr:hypothetical protein [Leptospira meyeri]MCW7489808.1 hypothetical protein [Leptospira meyeri]TGM62635.1 hypothetical protein EHQ93_15275 [Leptospira meyeri]TGM71061.1 hypothetical protein EHQ94_03320 [Leptospira meyeri]